jgi:hypothetical protein
VLVVRSSSRSKSAANPSSGYTSFRIASTLPSALEISQEALVWFDQASTTREFKWLILKVLFLGSARRGRNLLGWAFVTPGPN